MTTLATTADIGMHRIQKCGRCKTSGTGVVVTDTAFIQRRDMVSRLAYSSNLDKIRVAIVAGFTITHDARVIERLCWFKRDTGCVAHVTVLDCRYMPGGFSNTDCTIMTGRAIVEIYAYMVECRLSKAGGVMAG